MVMDAERRKILDRLNTVDLGTTREATIGRKRL
jgi:hypothetical protein